MIEMKWIVVVMQVVVCFRQNFGNMCKKLLRKKKLQLLYAKNAGVL